MITMRYSELSSYIKKRIIFPAENVFRTALIPNAGQPLEIPTYDGSGQVVHPSVIDVWNEYGIPRWSGYRYWMVLTPYPYSQDRYENPSLYASNDGLNWVVPQNITNPLDTAYGGWDKGFLFDPEMVYNPDTDQIWIYYQFANAGFLKMNLIRVNPDLALTGPVTIMERSPWSQKDNRTRSFCIWRECADRWHMWGGGGVEKAPYNTYYHFSFDGIHWGDPTRVLTSGGEDPFQALGLSNWHMSGKPNLKERRVEFFVYSTINSRFRKYLFSSKNPIIYAECSIDSPTIFSTPLASPVLLPSKTGWDNGHLYRCSFQIIDEGTRYTYDIWYSAEGSRGQWHLGHTKGYIGNSHQKNNDVSPQGAHSMQDV
jgi:hypothetical protein